MANEKISQLTAASSLTGAELIPIALSGSNYSTTPNQILQSKLSGVLGLLEITANTESLQAAQTGTLLQLGNANSTITRLELDGYANTVHLSGIRADGTAASPTTLQSGDSIFSINAWGYDGSAFSGPQAAVRMYANQNWVHSSALGTYVDIAVTPNGSTTLTEVAKFTGTTFEFWSNTTPVIDYGVTTASTLTIAGTVAFTGSITSETVVSSDFHLQGSSTGYTAFASANASATNYTLTFPAVTDTVVTLAATQTLTNKSISGSQINSGTVLAAYLPTATSSALGIVQPDNSTITVSAGVITAIGSSASAITVGTTDVSSGTSGDILYNNSGVLGNATLVTLGIAPVVTVNSQSTAYTTVLGDANIAILHPTSDNNARTFTIAANSSVAYPVGTTLTFINMENTLTIAITSDTLTMAGTGSTGSRTLAVNGVATAVKLTSTTWIISGIGLS